METRKKEKDRLKLTLIDMNLYEASMDVEEMRNLVSALQQSGDDVSEEYENNVMNAIRASEMDFTKGCVEDVFNSTTIDSPESSSGRWTFMSTHAESQLEEGAVPFNSPERQSQVYTVRAQVHHPLEWSPPRSSDLINEAVVAVGQRNQLNNAKREEDPLPAFMRHDSGVNCTGVSADSDISSYENGSSISNSDQTEENMSTSSVDIQPLVDDDVLMSDVNTTNFDYDDDSNSSL